MEGMDVTLKDIELKKAYDSDSDDILNDFYIPVLSHSVTYKRLAGFFSSSSLAIVARGVSKLIANGGRMKLVTGAKLRKSDVEAIREAYENPEKVIEKMMLEDLEDLEDKFVEDHVRALGWMVANQKFDIKVAIVCDENGLPMDKRSVEKQGIFHQKVGILEDGEGNKISFSGSDNESASAWRSNIEEFKLFRSWVESEKEYLDTDCKKFEKFWIGYPRRTKVIDVPRAVKERLIEIAPDNIEVLELDKWSTRKVKLWNHQEDAVNSWLANGGKGIFEMATGVGKTFAALGCLRRILERERKLVVVIACPFVHLSKQWRKEIKKFGISCDILIADSTNTNWKNELTNYLLDIENENKEKLIVLTTHNTFSTDDFIKIINKETKEKRFLIADEVHRVGAPVRKKGLIEDYSFRLGLSATPRRWFDLEGTKIIYDYFGGRVAYFGLEKAINTINPDTGETYLAPYRYIPKFVSLTGEELKRYIKESRLIAMKFSKTEDDEKDEILENWMLSQRANIIKDAEKKYEILEKILAEIGPDIKWTIIYCSPKQIKRVMHIVNKRDIITHRFTMEEGTKPDPKHRGLSEREFILEKFAQEEHQVLVAMKCLDQGVDVPPARTEIIMASSGNPLEYIQRIGRVIRRFPSKKEATIYDIVVAPMLSRVPKDQREVEWEIFKKELNRYEEIAKTAINNEEAVRWVRSIKERLRGEKDD